MDDDALVTAAAALDQLAAWYRTLSPFLYEIQETLSTVGVHTVTVDQIVLQQTERLFALMDKDTR